MDKKIEIETSKHEKHVVETDGDYINIMNVHAGVGLSMSRQAAIRVASAIHQLLGRGRMTIEIVDGDALSPAIEVDADRAIITPGTRSPLFLEAWKGERRTALSGRQVEIK